MLSADKVAREVAKNPWVRDHVAPGRQIDEFRVTKEFSYRSEHCAEDGLVLVVERADPQGSAEVEVPGR